MGRRLGPVLCVVLSLLEEALSTTALAFGDFIQFVILTFEAIGQSPTNSFHPHKFSDRLLSDKRRLQLKIALC